MIDFEKALSDANEVYLKKLMYGDFKRYHKDLDNLNILEEVNAVFTRTSRLSRRYRDYMLLKYMHTLKIGGKDVLIHYSTSPMSELSEIGPLKILAPEVNYVVDDWEEFVEDAILPRPCQIVTKSGIYKTGWYWPSEDNIAGVAFEDIANIRHLLQPDTSEEILSEIVEEYRG